MHLHETLGQWFQEWDKLAPETVSPVYVVTCPMVDRNGDIIHTLSRSQAFYDERGEYSWSISIIDSWQHQGPSPPEENAFREEEGGEQEEDQQHRHQPTASHPPPQPSPDVSHLLDDIYAQFLSDDVTTGLSSS
jgi:hypothetical protein